MPGRTGQEEELRRLAEARENAARARKQLKTLRDAGVFSQDGPASAGLRLCRKRAKKLTQAIDELDRLLRVNEADRLS